MPVGSLLSSLNSIYLTPRLRPYDRQNRIGFYWPGSEQVRILQKYLGALVQASVKNRPLDLKISAIILGGFTFLIVIPFLLSIAGYVLEGLCPQASGDWRKLPFPWRPSASAFLSWHGRPSRCAHRRRHPRAARSDSKELIVSGPYKLCRNPLQPGACSII